MFTTYNPATGLESARFAYHSQEHVKDCLGKAASAQAAWRYEPLSSRCGLLSRMATVLRAQKERYAALISQEMGKPIADALAEIEKCAWNCDFYAENSGRFLAHDAFASDYTESFVSYDPLGVVLAIMPWNYPFWQVFRFLAPALAAGNGVLLKHALNTPLCALATQEVFEQAGGPAGLFCALLIDTPSIQALIDDERVAAITLTGSTRVGAIVGSQSAKALKKQVLELGGSDPFIVLADADLPKSAKAAAKARFSNCGQACINAKRFIVDRSVADTFVDLFAAEVSELKVGDPFDPMTNIGPLARHDIRETLHHQVTRSIEEGAVLRAGGGYCDGPGFFYQPTILDHVLPSMTAFREETFGPLAAVVRAEGTEHAIRLANDTEFGLGASIWTQDPELAKQVACRIDAGAVFINSVVVSDPRFPFGGIKRSGYGRELGSLGIKEFTNAKTIVVS
ncbi:NAD-dependent succinate-semialdehyde dehydrogenase [Mesorhizobium sp. DCY119]|uniref:NAD-dependent succinate-semialdehyde dehydrogenase n=1 Tax=Mesorhizobium sp. DCY119 TaxID=2108445 RepID=UPI000E6CCD8C|nr:NAD-dependent succinate-semialdehyde dehydrogenase [Mesorhizobium sp. DCY119]RJG44383.1 NAD-dependent succinate-semialdehyde dehydrogenase [Mesorhizobium sp. DCY119]